MVPGWHDLLIGSAFSASSLFGVLGPVLFILGLATAAYSLWKTGANRAWKDAAEGWKAKCEERDQEIIEQRTREHDLRDKMTAQAATIAKLEALPNLERLLHLMSDTAQRSEDHWREVFDAQEKRAAERHDQLLELGRKLLIVNGTK